MFKLRQTDSSSLQVENSSSKNKTLIYVIGIVAVFIAAFMMFFTIRDYIHKIDEYPRICAQECSTEICETTCNFKKSASATINVILIFLFILVILGVYFIMAQSIGD